MKIKLLREDVIRKIAAGEVVERPASVIKELVENSLDAGAMKIEVKFINGGMDYIEISDNGIGMTAEEMKLAVKRHTTSKMSNFEDLNNMKTMGFRGEALSSIAAVSKMTVISRSAAQQNAFEYRVSDSIKPAADISPAARDGGTTVKVEHLFHNVPARRKFLKSAGTERRHIISLMESIIISREDISFKVIAENKVIFDIFPSSLKERFLYVAGKKMFDKTIEIDFQNPFLKLKGLISLPVINFANRSKIYIFVNNRSIYSPLITHAVSEGYRGSIPQGRYPAGVLKIEIEPANVDINVHPAKKEVRFVNQQGVHQIISKVIMSKMQQTSPVMDISIKKEKRNCRISAPSGMSATDGIKYTGSLPPAMNYLKDIDLAKVTKFTFSAPGADISPDKRKFSEKLPEKSEISITPYFQWQNKYIIGEDAHGIVIIDQHTAWERINYEKLKKELDKEKIQSQGLLISEIIEMESSRAAILCDNIKILEKFGIYIEEFGPASFKVSGIPMVLGRVSELEEIQNIIDTILDIIIKTGEAPDTSKMNDEIIKLLSCKSSIKAGDRMSSEETVRMITLLMATQFPHLCPHGRPIIIRLSEKEIDAKFKR